MTPLCRGQRMVGRRKGVIPPVMGEQHSPVLGGFTNVRIINIGLLYLFNLCGLVSSQMVGFPLGCLPAEVIPWHEPLACGDLFHFLIGQQATVYLNVGQISRQVFSKPYSGDFFRLSFITPLGKTADKHISNLAAIYKRASIMS